MAFTAAQINNIYNEILARDATAAEQAAWVALSQTQSDDAIRQQIADLPEAEQFVDPVIRLYQGAFNRIPDAADPNGDFDTGPQSGFWVNVNALRSGMSLLQLAEAFTVSAEFLALYGSNQVTPALITAYYNNILGRDPSAAEVAAWQALNLSAAQILIGFTQSAEFIQRSAEAVDFVKVEFSKGNHASGPLPGPEPEFTLDASVASVDEGQTVTFTLVGPADRAGDEFSYTIEGVQAGDVNVPLSGKVTLDAQGVAFLTVQVLADNLTDPNEVMTLKVAGLDVNVAVNDTSQTPLVFTETKGETIVGTDGNDTFIGTVNRTASLDAGTYQNVIDVAQGGKGFDTLFLQVDQSNVDIVPNGDVEHLKVTDLSGEDYNLANLNNLLLITSEGSSGGTMNFFNVKNIVDLTVTASDTPAVNVNVTVVDGAGGDDEVNLTLDNAGKFGLSYEDSNGVSVIRTLNVDSTGKNNVSQFEGAQILETLNLVGNGSFAIDFLTGENTANVKNVNASTFDGSFEIDDLDIGDLTILGATGKNDFNLRAFTGSKLDVKTQGGNDVLLVNTIGDGDGQSTKADMGDGNDTVIINAAQSDGDSVDISLGDGNNNAIVNIGAGSTVKVTGGDNGDTVTVNAFNQSDGGVTLGVNADIQVGDGANNVVVNALAEGVDRNSVINVLGGNGGNGITVLADDGATVTVTTGTAGDNIFVQVDDPTPQNTSSVNVNAGDGKNSVQVIGGMASDLTVTTGADADSIVVIGTDSAASITVNSGGSDDSLTLAYSGATIVTANAGSGDDRVAVATGLLHSGVTLDGGDGFDTLALTNTAVQTKNIQGVAKNFEALAVTDALTNDINVLDFLPESVITKVILEAGTSGQNTISGLSSGSTVEIAGDLNVGDSNDETIIMLNNAAINTKDVLNIKLVNDVVGTDFFGELDIDDAGFIETVNIESVSEVFDTSDVNAIELDNDDGFGNYTLNLSGTTTIRFDNTQEVLAVNAPDFTGGIIGKFTNTAGNTLTFFAPNAGDSNINFAVDGDANTVTLGNGNNTVNLGDGDDVYVAGSGQNVITGGLGQDTMTIADDADDTDVFVYTSAAQSQFSLPDVIFGFNTATDRIQADFLSSNTFHFSQVDSDVGVIAEIAALNTDTHVNVVFNTSDGNLYIDVDSNGVLNGADMQITLVGVTDFTAANLLNA